MKWGGDPTRYLSIIPRTPSGPSHSSSDAELCEAAT